jgi:hypothetical protein
MHFTPSEFRRLAVTVLVIAADDPVYVVARQN